MRPAAAFALLAGAALLGAALWLARPVLIWHLALRPEIERAGRMHRVLVPTLQTLRAPDARWTRLEAGALALRAPLLPGQQDACRLCAQQCVLAVEGGRLTLFDSALPASFDAAVAEFAPSAEDISILRPRAANWRMLEALANRAHVRPDPPEAFRYRTATSEGIVSRFESLGSERFVIYAFSPSGAPMRVVAVSRTGHERLEGILASLEVSDTLAAGCEAEGRP
jgi:hypothetical protein